MSSAQDPALASMPFDRRRDGFVLGEGAAVLVLEELQSARARGAPILAELSGYGLSGDGGHITTPSGEGAVRSMRSALLTAGLAPADIDYVNAHATSTPTGDVVELRAIANVFGEGERVAPVYVSSTKGATGHMLGAAGAIEAAFSVFALQTGQLPPTLNLQEPSPLYDNDGDAGAQMEDKGVTSFEHVPNVSKPLPNIRHVMSNSFGFGGTNASLIFSKYEE